MTRELALVGLLNIAIGSHACTRNSAAPSEDSQIAPVCTASNFAIIEGELFCANRAHFSYNGTTLTIGLYRVPSATQDVMPSAYSQISMVIGPIGSTVSVGPGEYPIGGAKWRIFLTTVAIQPNSGEPFYAGLMFGVPDDTTAMMPLGGGQVTLTEVGSERVPGSFAVRVVNQAGSGSHNVTQGHFSVTN